MYSMASSLFVWLKRCCRKAPASDQLRVGSGAGYEPATALEEQLDIKISDNVKAVPALHTAKADRLTVHLVGRGKAAEALSGFYSWLTYSPTRPMTLLFLIAVSAILSATEISDVGFSMNTTSNITDELDTVVQKRLGRRTTSLRLSGHSVSGDSGRAGGRGVATSDGRGSVSA